MIDSWLDFGQGVCLGVFGGLLFAYLLHCWLTDEGDWE